MSKKFFVMPYLVLFHDTMAYGSHHFMTNFKFQCVIREHLLFDSLLDFSKPEDRSAFDACVLLTQQGYCRNLAPVLVGEKVGILLSFEEQTISTVRLCFRVVRYDGVPVTCGCQTLLSVSRETSEIMRAPQFILNCGTRIKEQLESPSFFERIMAGKLREVFDQDIIALGTAVANSVQELAYPRFAQTGDNAHS